MSVRFILSHNERTQKENWIFQIAVLIREQTAQYNNTYARVIHHTNMK